MTPIDVFSALWLEARHAIEGETLARVGSVFYSQKADDDPTAADYRKGEHIRVLRTSDRLPKDVNVPAADVTMEEACNLAHELGHHRSFQGGTRTQEYKAALSVFDGWRVGAPASRCPTRAEQAAILLEEELAWKNGRNELVRLGVNEWAEFEAERAKGLENYREFFRNMEKPTWPSKPRA